MGGPAEAFADAEEAVVEGQKRRFDGGLRSEIENEVSETTLTQFLVSLCLEFQSLDIRGEYSYLLKRGEQGLHSDKMSSKAPQRRLKNR